jgi:hypothetical protein
MFENDAVVMVPEISTTQFSKSNSSSNMNLSERAPTEAKKPTVIA